MAHVDTVYKANDYYKANTQEPQNPFDPNILLTEGLGFLGGAAKSAASSFAGDFGAVKDDILNVGSAVKNFPFRSSLTVVGLGAVIFVGFKIYRFFKNR